MQAVTNGNHFGGLMIKICDHLPYLAATACFRICAITICLVYVNAWSVIPIAMYWMSNLFIGYRKYVTEYCNCGIYI